MANFHPASPDVGGDCQIHIDSAGGNGIAGSTPVAHYTGHGKTQELLTNGILHVPAGGKLVLSCFLSSHSTGVSPRGNRPLIASPQATMSGWDIAAVHLSSGAPTVRGRPAQNRFTPRRRGMER